MQALDINVTLGRRQILHGVDFSAEPGQVTAIVGPNGSGKTTLLRALTGEVSYTGSVILNGRDIRAQKAWELATQRGVLAQSTVLAFPFTVIEVVRLGLSAGLSAGRADLPYWALDRVDLADFANRYYQDLSGGEQQRVQLARVLTQIWDPVVDDVPRWLLLDEPVASLDLGHQFTVMDLMRDFAGAGGGVIAVMHDLNLTAMFADQVCVMTEGRIAVNGPPSEAICDAVVHQTYGCALRVNTVPSPQVPFLLPQARQEQTPL